MGNVSTAQTVDSASPDVASASGATPKSECYSSLSQAVYSPLIGMYLTTNVRGQVKD
jgi:hypothetical protein